MLKPANRWSLGLFLVVITIPLASCSSIPPRGDQPRSDVRFRQILEELAIAWNRGDAERAAQCFTTDAVYSQPPDKQLYHGRDALYRFFGGASGRPGLMTMRWHHLAFDQNTQVGMGEFSFTYGTTAHGVAIIRLRAGKIANWREYWYESSKPWEEFTKSNPF